MTSIELHIEELVLHLPVPMDGALVRGAVEHELARLIEGSPEAVSSAPELNGAARVEGAPIESSAGAGAEVFGRSIAGSIFAALGGTGGAG